MKILLAAGLFLFAALNCVFHYCIFAVSGQEDEAEKKEN